MKIFSLPILVAGAVALTSTGGLIYATTTAPSSTPPAVSTNSPAGMPPQPSGEGQHGHNGQKMQKILDQLNLTEAQKQQIAQIHQGNLPRKEQKQAIRAVLTPQQQAQFEQLRGSHGKPGGKHNPGGATTPTGSTTSGQTTS